MIRKTLLALAVLSYSMISLAAQPIPVGLYIWNNSNCLFTAGSKTQLTLGGTAIIPTGDLSGGGFKLTPLSSGQVCTGTIEFFNNLDALDGNHCIAIISPQVQQQPVSAITIYRHHSKSLETDFFSNQNIFFTSAGCTGS